MREVAVISGSTRFIPLIGHPVEQVKTPGPMNRWFAANNVDAVLLPMDIEGSAVPDFFSALRQMANCIGCSVTMPHKQLAYKNCDELTESARLTGAVNIIKRTEAGKLLGNMVDGDAMVAALRHNGVAIADARAVLVGAGGAGAAIALALAEAGVASLTILDVHESRSRELAASISSSFQKTRLKLVLEADDQFDIAINASPAGMQISDPIPLSLHHLDHATVVADAITKPAVTKWLSLAKERGIKIQTGLEMAFAQLPLQLAFWGIPQASSPSGL